jgi:hypothetical protein
MDKDRYEEERIVALRERRREEAESVSPTSVTLKCALGRNRLAAMRGFTSPNLSWT